MNARRLQPFHIFVTALLLVGCSSKEPEKPAAAESAKTQPSQPSPAATPTTPETAKPEPAAPHSVTRPAAPATQETRPTAPASTPAAPEPAATPPSSAPTTPPQKSAPAPVVPSPAPEKPAASVAETKAAPAAQPPKVVPKDVIILKAALGAVRFEHKLHSDARKIACETCHHPSRPEKPATTPQQACRQCHTLAVAPPMKTKLQFAFHNQTATAGSCIDCHKTANAKGQAAPVKCLDCHKRSQS
jgi:hypothetical protein